MMAAVYEVLRYLLERVPHSTQEQHDEVAACIDAIEEEDQGGGGGPQKKGNGS